MERIIDGNALVYADGAFNTPNGKTAHGLVRFTERYRVLGVIDRTYAGRDAGEVLDGKPNGIPVFDSLEGAMNKLGTRALSYFVIGLAPDGGRLPPEGRQAVMEALGHGLNVDSGLHDFLYKDPDIARLAKEKGCQLRDIRRTPEREDLHFFSGKIEAVRCLKVAILGTDSAIGKRTTAWLLVHGFREAGLKAEMVGTGQTAWLQGAKYSMIMDSCINDFVSGEIEHAVHEAWANEHPDLIVIEGQGSLMNPAYPGGFEILAAGRPDFVILQHAPKRLEYDGFPGYPLHPLPHQIQAIELISGRKVIAVTINHEGMEPGEIGPACEAVTAQTGLPAFDVLAHGPGALTALVKKYLR
ncbi:DUF1611 domain-containing protein [Robiginitalea marina]|uniref:DUF1611 domain-containing protein n=1 Tax=Robiginitalea marina TaxID=2954105 RepID=A0ABT1B0C5_9FLAO|nr:DUF1611 domain-containing protein [Robiginitalea marina]MCO5725748.1 DUF1611 domain-containing protein [Robiginitalea marina]